MPITHGRGSLALPGEIYNHMSDIAIRSRCRTLSRSPRGLQLVTALNASLLLIINLQINFISLIAVCILQAPSESTIAEMGRQADL